MSNARFLRASIAMIAGALMLVAGLAMAMPAQAHAAPVKNADDLKTWVYGQGGTCILDDEKQTVTLTNNISTSSGLTVNLETDSNFTLDLNGYTLSFTGGTTGYYILVNGEGGGRFDIRGYKDLSKNGTIKCSDKNLFRIIDCAKNAFRVSGVRIDSLEGSNIVASIKTVNKSRGYAYFTKDTIYANGGACFDANTNAEIVIDESKVYREAKCTAPLIVLSGDGGNATLLDSMLYGGTVDNIPTVQDTCDGSLNTLTLEGSGINCDPSTRQPETVGEDVIGVAMNSTALNVTDSCISGSACGVLFSAIELNDLYFESGTIACSKSGGNAIKFPTNKKLADFVGSKSFITPATKTNLGTDPLVGSTTYGTAQTITVRSKVRTIHKGLTWFNGSKVTPTISVEAYDGTFLTKSNYSFVYIGGHALPGKHSATLKFKGEYAGHESKNFTYYIKVKDSPVVSLTPIDDGFKVKVKKLSSKYVTGYKMKYSTSKTFKKSATKTVTIGKSYYKVSKTIKNLLDKKKYYIKTQAYKKLKVTSSTGVTKTRTYYSDWDGPWSVKTK